MSLIVVIAVFVTLVAGTAAATVALATIGSSIRDRTERLRESAPGDSKAGATA